MHPSRHPMPWRCQLQGQQDRTPPVDAMVSSRQMEPNSRNSEMPMLCSRNSRNVKVKNLRGDRTWAQRTCEVWQARARPGTWQACSMRAGGI